ncbi:phosphoesterase [Flammeovirga sp. MY04]|uniref:Metallophosphoesterase n=1 Tax=Flammeovirga yaeyamensis TaxID=367791 RepID=D0PR11_9BACT|nr:metallophosphoesterase [Flammeovirga sp. MY04]ACY02054.1 metallophosphoesterase [Flammeovirga yaeyamensis]ANQ51450.1 phosphoesterase [Flammeovirga sp. MY04]
MYDLIGDIHGHADELEQLLTQLHYQKIDGIYQHPSRKIIFVGDFIDRGPKIRETLEIVKPMVDHGHAIAVMGNHEYNAICFHLHKFSGGHLRPHLIKNIIQHYETLKQFQNRQKEYEEYIEWFLTLPLYYENDDLRVVHACWDQKNIDLLRSFLENDRLTPELIEKSTIKNTPFTNAVEQTLKGKELQLPTGISFFDKDGNERKEIRYKWWENMEGMTYQSISVHPVEQLSDELIDHAFITENSFYDSSEKPVFFGHYWLKDNPNIYKNNVCCLDYSVAKGGLLAAYSFNGEKALNIEQFSSI